MLASTKWQTHTSLRYAAFFLLLLGCFQHSIAQDATTEVLIEYSFTDKKFKSIVPFDVPFVVRFTSIPPAATRIKIAIREINKANDGIDKQYTATWNRFAGDAGTTGTLPVTEALKPNSDYLFDIRVGTVSDLVQAQKDALSGYLKTQKPVIDVINRILNKYAADPTSPLKDLTEEQKILNGVALTAIVSYNKDYDFNEATLVPALAALAALTTNAQNVVSSIRELDTELKKIKPPPANEVKVIAPYTNYDKIDWGQLSSGGPEFRKVRSDVEAMKTSLDTVVAVVHKVDPLLDALDALVAAKTAAINAIVDLVIVANAQLLQPITATYYNDLVKNASFNFSLDLGYAYSSYMDRFVSYTGVSIYFRPVNRNIPLRKARKFKDLMGVRTSLLLGITMSSVKKDNIRTGIAGDKGLVGGIGFRLTPWFRINGGAIAYYSYSTNPLISHQNYHTTLSPFVSFSIDMDAKSLFTSIFK